MGAIRRRRPAAPAALVVAVVLAWVSAALAPVGADVPPPAHIESNYESSSGHRLARDCGYSAPLPHDPSRSLWVFCDTVDFPPGQDPEDEGSSGTFHVGTFAADAPVNPGLVPTGLSELPTPPAVPLLPSNDGPQHFLTNPTGYLYDATRPCSYQARWANGLARGPEGQVTMQGPTGPVTIDDASQRLFITFADVCVWVPAPGVPEEIDMVLKATGVAAYNAATNTIVAESVVHAVTNPAAALPWQRAMFHPVFQGGHMYTYAQNCSLDAYELYGLCLDGAVTVGRVPVGSLSTAASYEYRSSGDPDGWVGSNDATAATDVLPGPDTVPGAWGPVHVDVHDLTAEGKGYVMMEQNGYGGHYRLWQAATPIGPWTSIRPGVMPGCPTVANHGCYHFWAHPELESGGQWLYSLYDMQSGRVELSSVGTLPDI